jgi:anaerobic selenocysteine-containing dehydrogenase
VVRIRGDRDDVFSHGFLCPKGSTLKQLHEDPDRLRRPLVRRDGRHVEVSWEEAFAECERARRGDRAHGREAIAVYLGNPNAHNLGAALRTPGAAAGLGTRQRFSAPARSTRCPSRWPSGYLFGTTR